MQGCFFVAKVLTIAKRRDKMKMRKGHRRSVMNIFKKIFGIFKKKEEEEEQQECWYNNAHEGSLGHAEPLPNDNSMDCTVAMSIADH